LIKLTVLVFRRPGFASNDPQEVAMNWIHRRHRLRRSTGILAGLACALLASVTAVPAALASASPGWADPVIPPDNLPPLPGGDKHPSLPDPARAHDALAGGMTAWQITLIVVGAAILAVAVAVLLARARVARRRVTATAS
jgi:hypothetical protein